LKSSAERVGNEIIDYHYTWSRNEEDSHSA